MPSLNFFLIFCFLQKNKHFIVHIKFVFKNMSYNTVCTQKVLYYEKIFKIVKKKLTIPSFPSNFTQFSSEILRIMSFHYFFLICQLLAQQTAKLFFPYCS